MESNKSSGTCTRMKETPLYIQIAEYVRNEIVSGHYGANDQLPTEMELAAKFNTSRPTVVKALDKLLGQGVIYKIQGKGSFVNTNYQNTLMQNPNIISLVMPFADHKNPSRLDELNIIKGIEQQLSLNNYNLMIHYCRNTAADFFATMRKVKESVSKGIIAYVAQNLDDIDEIYDIFLDNRPIVLLDKSIVGLQLPCVKVDNVTGASLAAKHLLDCNYDVICFLSDLDISMNESIRERYLGFRKAISLIKSEREFDHVFLNDDNNSLTEKMILEALSGIIKKYHGKRIGMLCVSDYFAYRVYEAVYKMGLSIPEQIGIIGFDGLDMPLPNQKHLSTIEHDFFGIGTNAADLMLEIIDKQNVASKTIITEVKLRPGDTTALK